MEEHEDFEVDPSESLERLMDAIEGEFEDELACDDPESADALMAAISIVLVRLADECGADVEKLVHAARGWLEGQESDEEDGEAEEPVMLS